MYNFECFNSNSSLMIKTEVKEINSNAFNVIAELPTKYTLQENNGNPVPEPVSKTDIAIIKDFYNIIVKSLESGVVSSFIDTLNDSNKKIKIIMSSIPDWTTITDTLEDDFSTLEMAFFGDSYAIRIIAKLNTIDMTYHLVLIINGAK